MPSKNIYLTDLSIESIEKLMTDEQKAVRKGRKSQYVKSFSRWVNEAIEKTYRI